MGHSIVLPRQAPVRASLARWWRHADPAVWPLRLVQRFAFSIIMFVGITTAAYLTGTIAHGLPPDLMARYGYTLHGIAHGQVYRIITSEMMTLYPAHVRGGLWMLLASLVPCELFIGTWRTAVTYWFGTLTATFLSALMSPLIFDPIGWPHHPDLIHSGDVGASVGEWTIAGTLAVVLIRRGGIWRLIGMGLVIGGLCYLLHILSMRQGLSDFGHPMGLSFGLLAGLVITRGRGPAWWKDIGEEPVGQRDSRAG